MSELFKVALSLSLSGSVLILLVFICSHLFGKTLSKRFQYYIWLVAVLRLLLPFSPESGIIPALWKNAPPAQVEQQVATAQPADLEESTPPPGAQSQPTIPQQREQRVADFPVLGVLWRYMWILWLSVAVGLMIRKITLYQSFVKYLRAGRSEVDDLEILNLFAELCERMGVRRAIGLYANHLIASPLILGFYKPAVVLPKLPENQEEFSFICLHELTHYKRKDIYYKWLLQIVLCLHWFNPLVHLMVREVNRSCELSCDEAVLRTLDAREHRKYGDALLRSLQTPGTYREGLAALTLNESAKSLKERLEAIMSYKKSNKITAVIAVMLAALLFVGGYALGAYSAKPQNEIHEENSGYTPEGLPIMSADNRSVYETYISPVYITGLLRVSFTPEDVSELTAYDGSIIENVFNAMQPDLFEEYAGAMPAAVVEETLMTKLPLYQWAIRDAFEARYNETTDTYELYGGLGGGPSTAIVTGSSRQDDLLTIYYTWYDTDLASDEFQYIGGDQGVLIVRLSNEDFQYVSNEIIIL